MGPLKQTGELKNDFLLGFGTSHFLYLESVAIQSGLSFILVKSKKD
jgi:hypothetical protein